MARKNGGIIGPANVPTGVFGSAPGVWSLTEVKKYINEGIWPVATSGFQVQNSLRFDDGSSDYLSRTPASASNRKTFTISVWFKRGILSSQDRIFDASTGATTQAGLIFTSGDGIQFYAGSGQINLTTNRLFRDVSAWYHVVAAVDTTQATSSDRVKLYVNGTQETSFSAATYPSLNYDTLFNSTVEHTWSKRWDADQYFDGYMAECVLIDGQQLTPSSFGETDATTGNWVPKDVSGLTFGTNGFYLPFQNSAALGQDDSGNGNDFTVNNLTSIDQTTDTPTNNFATWNALNSNGTLSEGSLECEIGTTDRWGSSGTFGISQGKWYWECKAVAKTGGTGLIMLGIEGDPAERDRDTTYSGSTDTGYSYYGSGLYFYNGSSFSYGDAYDTNDIIGVALDLDNNKLYFSKNGVWQNSGDPESGATGTGAISITDPNSQPTGFYFPSFGDGSTTTGHTVAANFGNPPFTISSGNTDFSGLGNFEYEVPSGYRALCTKNIGLVG